MRDAVASSTATQGFRAFKIGWGPFGRRDDAKLDEAIVQARARSGRRRQPAVRRCRRKRRLLAATACNGRSTPRMMLADYDVGWFEEALRPDAIDDFCRAAPPKPGADRRRRGADPPPELHAVADARRLRHRAARRDQGRRHFASSAASPGWPRNSASDMSGHGWNTALGVAADLQLAAALPHAELVEFIGGSAYVDGILTEPFKLDAEGYLEIPMRPGLGVTLDPAKVARYSPSADLLLKTS